MVSKKFHYLSSTFDQALLKNSPASFSIIPQDPITNLMRSARQNFESNEPKESLESRLKVQFQAFFAKQVLWKVFLALIGGWVTIAYFVARYEMKAQGANITSVGDAVWWGIVTLLTVGYGDRYPVTVPGRILGGVLMIMGVIAMGVLTAKISSYFLEQALREGRGVVDSKRLKDHFIVCGWTEDMDSLLTHILDFNPGLTSDKLVLIANQTQAHIDGIRSNPRLKDLGVILGDYFLETNLRRAVPERARKVLILADRTAPPNGQIPSLTETDARTIMTAMTLANMSRGTLVAAEILDPKMDQYLKLASVTEIIYSREYSRLLLGNATGGTGISNIIFDLLDPKTPYAIATHSIPSEYWNRPYQALKEGWEKNQEGAQVIGLLENSGNQHRIRELALRKAQQTPDIAKLVQNLKAVKSIECNSPVLNPSDDHMVNEGAMVIVLENRQRTQRRLHGDDSKPSPQAA